MSEQEKAAADEAKTPNGATKTPDGATNPDETSESAAVENATEASGDAATPEPVEPEIDPRDERIAELESEVAAMNDKLLRAAADVQNTLKRADRDRRDAETYGGRKLARDLLQVYDNLDSALDHASDALRESEPSFIDGVELTRKELLNAFAKHRIEPLEPAVGERFDANRHQAMFEAPAPGATPGTIIQVMQPGFMIAEQLLRPAMVGLASAAAPAPEADKSKADDGEAGETEEKASAD